MRDKLAKQKNVWNDTLTYIADQQVVPKTSFESWFQPLKVVDYHTETMYLGTQMEFIKEWVENNYRDVILRNLETVSDGSVKDVRFVLLNPNGSYTPIHAEEIPEETEEESPVSNGNGNGNGNKPYPFNPKYTFDTFVVGNSNRFAHAASLAVAEMPGKVYNPLFLVGGVGLGKTHLMQAIAQFILEVNPQAKVAYFSTERFVNDWINAIAGKSTEQFRAKYRYHDVILIDDIHFLEGKDSCQEELFHTYNALYDNGSQIIISSDRPPQEIPTLKERLASRFLSGLTIDIALPDLETRIAILKKKASLDNIYVPNGDILFYIANQIDSNIRILEGAFNRVVAFAKMNNTNITMDIAVKALKDYLPEQTIKVITIELIQQATTQHYHLKMEDMKSQKRTNSISFPRQIAMYLARELTDTTFEKIGEEFGNRHYSTVIHAHEEISQKLKSDPNTKKAVDDITAQIKKM